IARVTAPPVLMTHPFFLIAYGDHVDLHSFPTRRSSDLTMNERENRWSPEARPERTEPPESAVAHSARGTAHPAPTSSSSETAGLPETQSLELSAICGAGTAFHGSLSFSGRV